MTPYKVLIVDDSAVVRTVLERIIGKDPRFAVVAFARNGVVALERYTAVQPDIIILDIVMPEMDGLTFLERLGRVKAPILVFSTRMKRGARETIRAFELGAADFLLKPENPHEIEQLERELLGRMLALVRHHDAGDHSPEATAAAPVPRAATTAEIVQPLLAPPPVLTSPVIGIGISTGGPNTLMHMLPLLPVDLPAPIVIVQHMPVGFTRTMAERLDEICRLTVREAADGDDLKPAAVYIAPAGRQLRVVRSGRHAAVKLSDDEPVNGFRPSASVLFASLAELYGKHALGIIMTGMGNDGIQGLHALKQTGATIVAQDEASCVVYGMSRCAIAAGLADRIMPPDKIAEFIISWAGHHALPVCPTGGAT